jgi:hypothetical protein
VGVLPVQADASEAHEGEEERGARWDGEARRTRRRKGRSTEARTCARPWWTPQAQCARQTARAERPGGRARCAWGGSDGPGRARKRAAGRAALKNGACEAATRAGAKCELRGTRPMSRRAREIRCSRPELGHRRAGQKGAQTALAGKRRATCPGRRV